MNDNKVESKIAEYVLGKVAGMVSEHPDDLDRDENLLELGLESATLVQFAEEFEAEMGIKLYPTVFFEYQTLNQVINYFSDEYATEFSKYFEKDVSVAKETPIVTELKEIPVAKAAPVQVVKLENKDVLWAVSYTHLTLPTKA